MSPVTSLATGPTNDPVRAALSSPQVLADLRVGVRVLLRRVRSGITQTVLADLTEEVLSRTAETALTKSFDPTRGSSVPAWLYGIARMIVRKETMNPRHSAGQAGLDEAARVQDPAPPPDEEFFARCEAEQVREALGRLDPGERELLEMHYAEELTAPEIGARLDLPPGTVRVRLHRARKAVEALLRGEANP